VYVIVRIWLYSSSFTMGNWIGFAFLSLVNGLGLKLLFHYLSLGHPRSSYAMVEELLWVNWFVMAATVLSDWFWLVYLCVPAYAIYKFKYVLPRSLSIAAMSSNVGYMLNIATGLGRHCLSSTVRLLCIS